MSFNTALVIGAGAFGTSIGCVLAENFKKVILKVRSQDIYDGIQNGENSVYLPGQKILANMSAALTFDEAFKKVEKKIDLVVFGLPTAALKKYIDDNLETIQKFVDDEIPIVCLAKGIDQHTLELPDDIFFDRFADHREQFCFLSGPSFAKEIMQKQITLVSLAARSKKNLALVSQMFKTNYFMIFQSYDIKGLLLGGALKNILAIAGGILTGLGYNHNTRAAMITRGIAEMLRFGKVFNARPETFYGLSGMGDLILTTTGGLSRNLQFGLEVAKGRKAIEIINSQRSVVEGYKTSKAAHLLSEKYDISCRIFNGVYDVLYEDKDPRSVIHNLMKTGPRFEID